MAKGKATTIPGIYATDQPDRWVIRIRKPNERIKTVVGTFAEAHAVLEQMKAEAEQVQQGLPPPGTLGAWAGRWLISATERRKSKPAVAANRAFHLRRFILPFFGHLRVSEVKAKHISEWKDWMVKQVQPPTTGSRSNPHEGERYAHSTLVCVWTTFRTFAGFVSMHEEVRNPMEGQRWDVYGEEAKEKDALTADEAKRVIECFSPEKPDIRVMIMLGLATGCRFAEYSACLWSDIDWETKGLSITKSQIDGHVGRPKTASTRRRVDLPDGLLDELQRHRTWLAEQKRPNPWDLVFPAKCGQHRSPVDLRNPLRRALMRAGIAKHVTAHCLRHTTNDLLRQATSETVTRGMIGHSSSEMTRRYSHVEREERMRALSRAYSGLFDGDQPVGTPTETRGDC